jgi:hypothetical protein
MFSSTTARAAYTGNGATTSFSFPYLFYNDADLAVYRRDLTTFSETPLTLNADYTVTGKGNPGGGNVVFAIAPTANQRIVIARGQALTQGTDLVAYDSLPADTVEQTLDQLVMALQRVNERVDRALLLPITGLLANQELPEPKVTNAGFYLGIDAGGTAYELKAAITSLVGVTVSAFILTLLDDADAATARATLDAERIINNLTTDTTGAAHTDFIPFADASEGFASNKMLVSTMFTNAIANSTDTTPALATDYEVMARKLSDGSLHKMLLSELGIGKNTIGIPAGAMWARTTNGAAAGTVELATNRVMVKSYDFDATTQEHIQFQFPAPKGSAETTLTAVFVWSHAATATNFGVRWGAQLLALGDNEAQDQAFGTGVEVTDTGGTTNNLYRSPETTAITPSNSFAEGDILTLQVYRAAANGADTMTIDARLQGVILFYTTNANVDD